MSCDNSLSPEQLAIISGIVAAILAKSLNLDQMNVLGNFLSAVSASLLTIQAKLSEEQSQQQIQQQKDDIENQIKELKNQLKQLGC